MELKAFCKQVQFILYTVKEDEYQAAVTLMKPPEKSYKKAVIFPHHGTVIGMFADKKTALIHISEGSECSNLVQSVLSTFPNVMFIIGIGVGYAYRDSKYKLGDVLVSKQICDCRLKNGRPIYGQRINVVNDLLATFCMDLSREEDFKVSDKDRSSQVGAGQFVTLSANVMSEKVHEEIHRSLPQAIGGDMDDGTIMKFRCKKKIDGVMLIKGASYYADWRGEEDEWNFTASLAALKYAESKLYSYTSKM